jgi:hypothetical protein
MKAKALSLAMVLLLSPTASSQIVSSPPSSQINHVYYGSYSAWYRQREYIKFAYLMGVMDTLTTYSTSDYSQPKYYSNCARKMNLTNAQLANHLHQYVTKHPKLQEALVTRALQAYLQEVCG